MVCSPIVEHLRATISARIEWFCRPGSNVLRHAKSAPMNEAETLTTQIMNPVIRAVDDTFEKMLECQAVRRSMTLYGESESLFGINAVIGLVGEATGSICLSLSDQAAVEMVRRVLDMDVESDDAIISDTVGEFSNLVAGAAKCHLTDVAVDLGLPNIVRGRDVRIRFPSQAQPLRLDFDSKVGPFVIAFGIA